MYVWSSNYDCAGLVSRYSNLGESSYLYYFLANQFAYPIKYIENIGSGLQIESNM